MIIPVTNPDDFVGVSDFTPCKFHEIAPGHPYAGCTCRGSFYQRRATPEEKEENRKRRIEREKKIREAYRAVGLCP